MVDNEQIIFCVNEALDRLYNEDLHLIIYYSDSGRHGVRHHVGERAIVFRFGLYLFEIFSQKDYLKTLDLDCEYNRNGKQPKKLPAFGNGTYPDIILHKRGSNDFNTLVMEFKGYWNNNINNDFEKLCEFTKQRSVYNFNLGLFVFLGKTRDEVKMTCFVDGTSMIMRCESSQESTLANDKARE